MAVIEDPFVATDVRKATSGEHAAAPSRVEGSTSVPMTGCLYGFDILDQPTVTGLATCPGEVLVARSTVALRRAMIGQSVVLLFEQGDVRSPIIVGVIEPKPLEATLPATVAGTTIRVDGERHVIEAEREIVLRCGDASITLTRAGKVIVKGNYILSRSTGYNKIKGAAIDIN